jgi:hypothetical protein
MASGLKNVKTDLSVRELLTLAFSALTVPSKHVTNQIVPATAGSVGSASVVFISPSARALYADMRHGGLIGNSKSKAHT